MVTQWDITVNFVKGSSIWFVSLIIRIFIHTPCGRLFSMGNSRRWSTIVKFIGEANWDNSWCVPRAWRPGSFFLLLTHQFLFISILFFSLYLSVSSFLYLIFLLFLGFQCEQFIISVYQWLLCPTYEYFKSFCLPDVIWRFS